MMDGGQLVQAAMALVFVLGLLLALAFVAKRSGLVARVAKPVGDVAKTLQVTEILPIDMKHKVVRIRDGEGGYLVMLGGEQPLLLERWKGDTNACSQ